ncbi:hypothetical protein, partial [Streptomyces fradiae]|uniref:hypothetical protein n=1 Tax=Streptomyces fradiae TaxID=1906 RepID=UPI0033C661B1
MYGVPRAERPGGRDRSVLPDPAAPGRSGEGRRPALAAGRRGPGRSGPGEPDPRRLDTGEEELRKEPVLLDAVVASGLDGAVE